MKKKTLLLIAASLLTGNILAQEVPNAKEFLPGPPNYMTDVTTSVQYIKDYLQYEWGKTERNTELGRQAKIDSETDLNKDQYAEVLTANYLDAFSKVVGLELSSRNTPNIYTLFNYCVTYGERAQEQARTSFESTRPYARFNQTTLVPEYEDQYKNVSSYPSSQAMMGWLFALMLTEICPDKQDAILARGYAYGTSSVISGYHWDSDSYAGCLLASALVARMHTHTGSRFNEMVTSAINEYERKSGITNNKLSTNDEAYLSIDELPDGHSYLPEPPTTESPIFATDLSAHINGLRNRTTDEGATARRDVDDSVDYLCSIFADVLNKDISSSSTPQTYKLFDKMYESAVDATQKCKDYYQRQRPYVQLNESTSYPPDEDVLRDNGSYPSGHACASWLYALVMSEIAPDYQEALLDRAFKYGNGRVITGYHWQSDVDMGRLVGSAAYARMHFNSDFMEQLKLAQKEFNGGSGIRTTTTDDNSKAQIYTLEGVRLNDTPTRSGIYIRGNKKVAY